MDIDAEIPWHALTHTRPLCHLVLKFFPWNEAVKVTSHLSLTLLFPHVSGAEGVTHVELKGLSLLCAGWIVLKEGWGGGPRRMPDSFPIHALANENSGK